MHLREDVPSGLDLRSLAELGAFWKEHPDPGLAETGRSREYLRPHAQETGPMADNSNEASPLAGFGGEPPPAPDWFRRAMAVPADPLTVEVEGAAIEALAWGERGRPGLIFVHGAGAHMGWWRFIAPFFAQTHRVAALSLSGMGGSGWRETYSTDLHAAEVLAVAETAGLLEGGHGLTVVGHSYGGRSTLRLAARCAERLERVIVMDTILPPPDEPRAGGGWPGRPTRIYATTAEALARFRLAPMQPCENSFIVDAIARESLGPGKDGEGFTWKFDPMLFARGGTESTVTSDLLAARTPVALIFGDRSKPMPAAAVAAVRRFAPDVPIVVLPEAEHHIMLDQPLALVAALRALLAVTPR